jgi:hypothetical protein
MAKLALRQIEAAIAAFREIGEARLANFYDAQTPKARALVVTLAGPELP